MCPGFPGKPGRGFGTLAGMFDELKTVDLQNDNAGSQFVARIGSGIGVMVLLERLHGSTSKGYRCGRDPTRHPLPKLTRPFAYAPTNTNL